MGKVFKVGYTLRVVARAVAFRLWVYKKSASLKKKERGGPITKIDYFCCRKPHALLSDGHSTTEHLLWKV